VGAWVWGHRWAAPTCSRGLRHGRTPSPPAPAAAPSSDGSSRRTLSLRELHVLDAEERRHAHEARAARRAQHVRQQVQQREAVAQPAQRRQRALGRRLDAGVSVALRGARQQLGVVPVQAGGGVGPVQLELRGRLVVLGRLQEAGGQALQHARDVRQDVALRGRRRRPGPGRRVSEGPGARRSVERQKGPRRICGSCSAARHPMKPPRTCSSWLILSVSCCSSSATAASPPICSSACRCSAPK
jgi:hypothetical protein